jgi:HK97 family phage prohead protease
VIEVLTRAVLSDDEGRSMFDGAKHPRAPKGSQAGGEFAPAKQSSHGGKKATGSAKPPLVTPAAHHSDTLGYDGKTGTGYSSKNGDPRVHRLQQALNRLGLTDAHGKKLVDDGKLGPKTTEAVKAAQKRLGLPQDGKVTPKLLAALESASGKAKPKAKAKPHRAAGLDLCVRSFEFETRTAGGDGRTLEGYAAVFNTPTRIRDLKGDFDEVILPGAFKRSLTERTPLLQWDHGKDPRIGTVPIGAFEDIREDGNGLHVRARLFDHPDVERVREAIAGGAVKGMSFRFGVPEAGEAWTRQESGVDLREIGDADIHECGPVAFPAYQTTSVNVRSFLAGLDPEETRTLVHELAAHLRRAVDLEDLADGEDEDLTGESDAWSADRGEPTEQLDARPGNGTAPPVTHRQRLDDGALRVRGILT